MDAEENTAVEAKRACDRSYYQRNRERIIAKRTEYKRTHPEKVREWAAGYYQRNKERFAKYYHANREKQRAQAQARYLADKRTHLARVERWKKQNPERFRRMRLKEDRQRRATLSDGYVRRVLSGDNHVPQGAWPLPLIEAKRAELKIRRAIREQTQRHDRTA